MCLDASAVEGQGETAPNLNQNVKNLGKLKLYSGTLGDKVNACR